MKIHGDFIRSTYKSVKKVRRDFERKTSYVGRLSLQF